MGSLVVCVHRIRIAEDVSRETVLKRNNAKTELAQKRSIMVVTMNAMKNAIKADFTICNTLIIVFNLQYLINIFKNQLAFVLF